MTISVADESAPRMAGASIGTTEDDPLFDLENNKWAMAGIVLAINLIVTCVAIKLMVSRQDGMQRIGWTASQVDMNGKPRQVYMPVFVKADDYRELTEVKK